MVEWDAQVSGRTSDCPPQDLTRAAIAFHASKTLWKFMATQPDATLTLEDGTRITYDDILLLELSQVTVNSYQIIFAYLFKSPI